MIAGWLGSAAPVRSIRWLDGVLAVAAKLGPATAIAAGDATWLELASDRAARAGVTCMGITTDLKLDYLGWAQIVGAAVRDLKATTVLVDEVSRPERFPEVAAIAEVLDVVQLTRVIALAANPSSAGVRSGADATRSWIDTNVLHASRISGREVQTIRIKGPAVLGIRIAGAPLEDYPTPTPSKTLVRRDLPSLGLDPLVLGHRALPPRATTQTKKTVEHIGDHLAYHLAPRGS